MKNNIFNPSIYREYDIRGVADKDLSVDFAYALGKAYATYAYSKKNSKSVLTISVGRDCRLTSDKYASALIDGLTSSGINVIDIGVCPTPLTYFSVFEFNLDGGIMITGSHNPAEYNGFKICLGKSTLYGEEIQKLKQIIESNNTPTNLPKGTIQKKEIIPIYINFISKQFMGLKNKKIVLDAGNGTASTVAPLLFEAIGATVIPLFCELDGRFPNHHPDPTVHKNLEDLIKVIKSEKADFGFAFDGDSDRIGVVDEKGRVYFGDELMIIFARSVLKSNPGATIISEVKSSNRLYEDIKKRGGNPIMWKTGHSLIKSKMKETNSKLAGEMSGHIFFNDKYFGYDDAIYAAARFYEIATELDKPVSSLIEDLTPVVATPEIRVGCIEEKKFQLVEGAKKILSKKYTINDIDGVRVDLADSWGLIRASNTQPVLVLRFEAVNNTKLSELQAVFMDALSQAAKEIGHGPIHT